MIRGFRRNRVVRHLRKLGFTVRVASWHPARARELFGDNDPNLQKEDVAIRCSIVIFKGRRSAVLMLSTRNWPPALAPRFSNVCSRAALAV
jgi:hypothetical protein